MSLRLYNSLTRQLEAFEPLAPPQVTLYACGPTVWNYAHVGNFRTFLLVDLLRRYLAHLGFDVFLVMNLTDVDDRIIREAGRAGRSVRTFTDPFARAFFEDRDYLRILPADGYPRATDYVAPMIGLVTRLLERGLAYQGEDGSVYFSVGKFKSYGRLSRLDPQQLKTGSRVASDDYAKEEARDFALWKAASEADEAAQAAWDAPFGRGRPGWHLECSAMALTEVRTRVGVETVDIHTGGVDLLFPHHENEIAQSEGATGQTFARVWLHGEFLMMAGTKMSKRFGNVLTVRDLREEGVDPAAFRMLVFSTHYRQKLNFTDDALEGAAEGTQRLAALRRRLLEVVGGERPSASPLPDAEGLERGFRTAMDEDLNAPKALGAVFSFVRTANRALDEGRWSAGQVQAALTVFDRIVGLLDVMPRAEVDEGLARWVEARVEARRQARAERDFATADAIRAELAARGIELEDTPQGTRWSRRTA